MSQKFSVLWVSVITHALLKTVFVWWQDTHLFSKDAVRLRDYYTVSLLTLCTPAETGTAVSSTLAAVSDTDVRYCRAEVK